MPISRAGVKEKVIVEDVENRKVLEIGNELWPLPFPIAKRDDGKWAFDTYTGLEEIANRRVGENELQAIATMRAYVDAQQEYALQDHDGDGVLEYAQKLMRSGWVATISNRTQSNLMNSSIAASSFSVNFGRSRRRCTMATAYRRRCGRSSLLLP